MSVSNDRVKELLVNAYNDTGALIIHRLCLNVQASMPGSTQNEFIFLKYLLNLGLIRLVETETLFDSTTTKYTYQLTAKGIFMAGILDGQGFNQ